MEILSELFKKEKIQKKNFKGKNFKEKNFEKKNFEKKNFKKKIFPIGNNFEFDNKKEKSIYKIDFFEEFQKSDFSTRDTIISKFLR